MLGTLALAWWAATAVPSHATILLYHHVSDETPPSTSLSPVLFAEQLMWLDEQGYTVMTLEAVVDSLRGERPLPDRTVVFTFDDGYASVYEEAFPRLRARGWPFTVFVCPEDLDAREVELIMNVNFMGAVTATEGVLKGMLERGRGQIVAISSLASCSTFSIRSS